MTKKLLCHIYGGGSEKKYTKAKGPGKPGIGFTRYRNSEIFTTHPGLMYHTGCKYCTAVGLVRITKVGKRGRLRSALGLIRILVDKDIG